MRNQLAKMKTIYYVALSVFISQLLHATMSAAQQTRSKRFVPLLVFPVTSPTRVQFIGGIGLPLEDLPFEALITGWVLKAEYNIPTTAESLFTPGRQPINSGLTPSPFEKVRKISKRPMFENFLAGAHELKQSSVKWLQNHKPVLSNYRWVIYKALEGLADRMGLTGRECVLKSICEFAEEPFHYANGVTGELLHILLTPSSSADVLSEHADNEYFYAESIGHTGASCDRVFKACPRSLLTHFSQLHDILDSF